MIGTGHIIAHRLRRVATYKHGPGVAYPVDIIHGIGDLQFKVLGRYAVGQVEGRLQRIRDQNGPVRID